MARRRTKKRSIIAGIFTVLLVILFVAVAGVAAAYLIWSQSARPRVTFHSNAVTMEAGTRFRPMAVINEVKGMPRENITVDTSALDVNTPGEYEVRYNIDTFPISKEVLSRARLAFISPEVKVQSVTVTVADRTPPEVETVTSPYRVKRGETVTADELVKSIRDLSDVTISFADGTESLYCGEDGTYDVVVAAEDAYGNREEKTVTLEVYGRDIFPPVISGAEDLVLQVGETFEPMSGVTAKDSTDGTVAVKLVEGSVDTSAPGSFEVTYSAVDEAGNRAVVRRHVAVYERTAGEGAQRFGLLWDNVGSADQPYLVAVNRVRNVVTVYGKNADGNYTVPEKAFVCSIGEATPTGYFYTGERYRWHDLQENCFGQYATRITGHILFHSVPYTISEDPSSLEYEEYNKLGSFASLGCVRMTVEDSKWIFDNCPNGFPCVIYDDDLSNGPLGKPAARKIDVTNEVLRGWDPTDPDPLNPWISELKEKKTPAA